jgi:hypothetical protein
MPLSARPPGAPSAKVATADAPEAPESPRHNRLAGSLRQVLALLEAPLLKVCALISAPVASKPAVVRDSIGWLALNSVFLAACLWGYLLLIRTPGGTPHAPGTYDLSQGTLPAPPSPPPPPARAGDAAGHGGASGDHGSSGSKPAGAKPKGGGHH